MRTRTKQTGNRQKRKLKSLSETTQTVPLFDSQFFFLLFLEPTVPPLSLQALSHFLLHSSLFLFRYWIKLSNFILYHFSLFTTFSFSIPSAPFFLPHTAPLSPEQRIFLVFSFSNRYEQNSNVSFFFSSPKCKKKRKIER